MRSMPPLPALVVLLLLSLPPASYAALSPNQITGSYTLLPLTKSTSCPSSLRFLKAEYDLSQGVPRYVIAHANTLYTRSPSAPQLPPARCISTPVSSVAGITLSATVLRRGDQIRVERAPDLLSAFYATGADTFYVGTEVAARFCGENALGDGQLSLWALPLQPVTARYGNLDITFRASVKYIFYFSEADPCLYEGNVADVGAAATTVIPVTPATTAPVAVTSAGPIVTSSVAQPSAFTTSFTRKITTATATTTSRRTAFDNPECLPGFSTLTIPPGVPRSVSSLRIGDIVQVSVSLSTGQPIYEPIYAFSHASPTARPIALIHIATASNLTLAVTPGHLVPLRARGLVPARNVRANGADAVYDARNRAWTLVRHVVNDRPSIATGLFNPHTSSGTVIVDGVLVSCFTTALLPRLAVVMLAPARALFAMRSAAGQVASYVHTSCFHLMALDYECQRGFGYLPRLLESVGFHRQRARTQGHPGSAL
jgi:Hint module